MYSIGGKVVHPFYGPGRIVDIQSASMDGTRQPCCVIETVPRPESTRFIIPFQGAKVESLRPVVDLPKLRRLMSLCAVPPTGALSNEPFLLRQRHARRQLRSGSLEKVVSVVRELTWLGARKSFSIVDRRLLAHGKELLGAELALVLDIEFPAAMQKVEAKLAEMVARDDVE